MLYNARWDKVDAVGRQLLNAAVYQDRHGWVRAHHKTIHGEVCVVTALCEGCAICLPRFQSARYRLESYLGMNAVYWNDRVCRSKAEAVAALRAAARHV